MMPCIPPKRRWCSSMAPEATGGCPLSCGAAFWSPSNPAPPSVLAIHDDLAGHPVVHIAGKRCPDDLAVGNGRWAELREALRDRIPPEFCQRCGVERHQGAGNLGPLAVRIRQRRPDNAVAVPVGGDRAEAPRHPVGGTDRTGERGMLLDCPRRRIIAKGLEKILLRHLVDEPGAFPVDRSAVDVRTKQLSVGVVGLRVL